MVNIMWIRLAAAVLCFTGCFSIQPEYLHCTYGSFYDLPMSLTAVKEDDSWSLVGTDSQYNAILYSYTDDPSVILLFCQDGNICGVRMCMIKEYIPTQGKANNLEFPIDYDSIPLWKTYTYWDTECWCSDALLASPETLKSGVRNNDELEVWLAGGGEMTRIPNYQCDIVEVGYTKQACVIGMGLHYFYNTTPSSECATMETLFALYDSGMLIGVGFNPVGSCTYKDRKWFESGSGEVVKAIQPNGPSCLPDWIDEYGMCGLHIFFKHYPALTFCTEPWQNDSLCDST